MVDVASHDFGVFPRTYTAYFGGLLYRGSVGMYGAYVL